MNTPLLPLHYYLGYDYKYPDGEDMWICGSTTYTDEVSVHVKCLYGTLAKESTDNRTQIPVYLT